uniref:Uncharacterized protein n=1 Tax=Oncorhynchus mykiss TaxID=8022 RepID=A0A8C7W9B6_ONCMY
MLKDQGGTLKASCFFGQLPTFESCGLTLYQINVVRRHLAQKHKSLLDSGKEGYLKGLFWTGTSHVLMVSSFFLKMSLADYALILLLIHHQKYTRRLCARPNLHAYLESEDFKNRPIIPGKRA